MKSRQKHQSQEASAAKADISVRSGRRIEKGQRQQKKPRGWKTRDDPFKEVWESEIVPLLVREPELTGMTLWEYLDECYPGKYPESHLRTLQRRIKHWKATQGPEKPVIFRQSLPPGHQGLSDFSHPRTAITIAGKEFPHLLFQFRLAFSGWRHVHVVQGGESYSALAEGLQNALHQLGGAPREHRTDSLTAAYTSGSKQDFTDAYRALCQHYGMIPTVNNCGISHENGAIETSHGSLKHRVEQAIKMRGSADFTSVRFYQDFLEKVAGRLNNRCKSRLAEEQQFLRSLPLYRFPDYSELSVKVTTSSTISVKRVLYTVPSRLVGETLRVHLYHDRLECFVSQTRVTTLPRVYPGSAEARTRRIDYRHIIHALAAKPQAFRFSQLQDDILPTDQYQKLWELAEKQFDSREACKWMVTVLRLAYDYDCESQLAAELLKKDPLPGLKELQKRFLPGRKRPDIPAKQHTIEEYDMLLNGNWASSQGGRHV